MSRREEDPNARGDHRLDAYYYSFEETGVPEVDDILAAVAHAGKRYHNTDRWDDDLSTDTERETPVQVIQRIANRSADQIRSRGKS